MRNFIEEDHNTCTELLTKYRPRLGVSKYDYFLEVTFHNSVIAKCIYLLCMYVYKQIIFF